jgi:hypothetical protein
VTVAVPKGQRLDWLAKDGFVATGQSLTVGHWGWPYRYRNRPPTDSTDYALFAKAFAPAR